MKVSYLLLISILIVGALCIPAVSAETITGSIYDPIYEDHYPSSATIDGFHSSRFYGPNIFKLQINHTARVYPERIDIQNALILQSLDNYLLTENHRSYTGTLGASTTYANVEIVYDKVIYNSMRQCGVYDVSIFLDWDTEALNGLTGVTAYSFIGFESNPSTKIFFSDKGSIAQPKSYLYYEPSGSSKKIPYSETQVLHYQMQKGIVEQYYEIIKDDYGVNLNLIRKINGVENPSKVIVKDVNNEIIYESNYIGTNATYNIPGFGHTLLLESLYNQGHLYEIYRDTSGPGPTPTPTQPTEPTVINRTGTVTMTDHNGTAISGFEVTAVNYYTHEEYTFLTDTDVAVISLPMDRTTEIRNPQTGEYEETAIGYYRFYGQKAGYKMLLDEGIQVAVMPEKYGSYQLCDILVTSESDYLTGQHKFQIRSRSDNSVLQTGTISAKSATTNVWYNTTVTNGIATLILPYDTSNPISQYAGNYYVYATSPGYQDSDYGTQIVVMPHTVSEINTVLLTPIGGVPAAGNVTLRIQAFSEYGPGVANASIFIAGVVGAGSSVWDTYTASSTGYLAVSVPGNSTYDIVASAEGYYDSARRIEVLTEPPGLIEMKLYFSGPPTVEPTTQPTGWPTTQPTTQPTGGIPDDDDGSESFLMQAVRGIGLAFGVGFSTAKLIFGMLLALSIGFATAKHLRGGAAEFGLGLVGGTMLGVLIGLLPVWTVVVLLLIVGLYIGNRYIGGSNNG